MKRLLLTLLLGAGALLAMYGSTPPHIAETQAISHLPAPPEAPKIVQQGKASYYADSFHGRTTASGEPMDQNALTAASKELPLGSRAKVTNLATGESVMVEINDRGPFVAGRVIDLSKRAADALDMRHDGVAPVKVEANPEDQPTPELKRKVAKVAVARAQQAAAKAVKSAKKKAPTTQIAESRE